MTLVIGKSSTSTNPAALDVDGQAEPPKILETRQALQQADCTDGQGQELEGKAQVQALAQEQEQEQEQDLAQGPTQSLASELDA